MWSTLPATVDMRQIDLGLSQALERRGHVQRLESVLHSEIASMGQPRAALLAFAVSVMAYDVLTLIARCVERAHELAPEVSFFHLVVQIRSGYGGMVIAPPPEHRSAPDLGTSGLVEHPLRLARRIRPESIAKSKRGPKAKKPKGYVDGPTARAHVATSRVMAKAELTP